MGSEVASWCHSDLKSAETNADVRIRGRWLVLFLCSWACVCKLGKELSGSGCHRSKLSPDLGWCTLGLADRHNGRAPGTSPIGQWLRLLPMHDVSESKWWWSGQRKSGNEAPVSFRRSQLSTLRQPHTHHDAMHPFVLQWAETNQASQHCLTVRSPVCKTLKTSFRPPAAPSI